MENNTTETHTAGEDNAYEQLRANAINNLWEVTHFLARHCVATLGSDEHNSHDVLEQVAHLRDIVETVETMGQAMARRNQREELEVSS